jgi:cyclopentanol dehydrogenase
MARLKDKVAIITGAAGGIGAAVAKLFAQEGARVVITDVQEQKLKTVVGEIIQAGGTATYCVHDVSSEYDWEVVIEKTSMLFGDIHILVNNAGIVGNIMVPLEERSVSEFNKVIAVNLLSQFIGTKAVLPFMKKNWAGSIINVSSIGGIIGSANATGYTASKGGIRSFTKGAAAELAAFNIRVNSVHPGYVATPMTKGLEQAADFGRMAVGATPLNREASPEEIAPGILYLASDESGFTTGCELVIDGGAVAL